MPRRYRKPRSSRWWSHPAVIAAGSALIGLGGGLLSLRWPLPDQSSPDRRPAAVAPADDMVRTFSLCYRGGGTNCVVDGDTLWLDGTKIRIADIDTPETHPPRCTREAQLGRRATTRLQELVNQGAFSVEPADNRDTDRYGRKLRILTRRGESLGDILVREGLARPWEGSRRPWCP